LTENPIVLRIALQRAKTIDDLVAIARNEGKRRFGCEVDLTDLDKRSDVMYWVEVRPRRKYPSLDVEASKTL